MENLLNSAVKKSCKHKISESLTHQTKRLARSGFPGHIIKHQGEKLLGKLIREGPREVGEREKKVVKIPYYHGISHRIRREARKFGIEVVFHYPNKLSGLPAAVNRERLKCPEHVSYVQCVKNCVYAIPLTCNKVYVGQTGRCANVRFREHERSLASEELEGKLLAQHQRTCGCQTIFRRASFIKNLHARTARELVEAYEIHRGRSDVISEPSIGLTRNEKVLFANFGRKG